MCGPAIRAVGFVTTGRHALTIFRREHRHETRKEMTRQQRELEAESISFAVLAHCGIHSESRFYLASYEVTGEMLIASSPNLSQTSRRIISTIDGNGKTIEDAGEGSALSPIAA